MSALSQRLGSSARGEGFPESCAAMQLEAGSWSCDVNGYVGLGVSSTSLSLSVIQPSSGSEPAFIFFIALLRSTFTVASAMPKSNAVRLLRRPCAT